MSSIEPWARHHRWQSDLAVGAAFRRLAAEEAARERFAELLHGVRQRAPRLFEAPVSDGVHLGVEALVQLALFGSDHVRPFAAWSGCAGSWRVVVHSLASHLLARFRVPAFLSAAWYGSDAPFGLSKRRWFVAHGQGASFRSLDLPMRMTRKMEHLFLASHDHLSIERALRRAELLGLGADDALVVAVLAAAPALDLHHGEFWHSAWQFLIAQRDAVDLEQVAPLIDFLHAVRHEQVAIDTPEGVVTRPPLLPAFSLKGRTLRSVMRLMAQWHRTPTGGAAAGLSWQASRLRPVVLETPSADPALPPTIWELTELTNGAQLRAEGAALQHCVAGYGQRCRQGRSRIWSLRRRRALEYRQVLTIEVDPKNHTIVQARGLRNRRPSGKPLGILRMWAAREGLRVVAM